MVWEYKNTVLIYKSKDFAYNSSVAACGFSHTLLKRSKPFPETWELWSPKILEKFKIIHEKKASIVFFSNQYGENVSAVKSKFAKFIKTFVVKSDNPVIGEDAVETPIPIVAFFAMKKNCFKKPFTNLWKILNFTYQKRNLDIPDPSMSIFIGSRDGGMYLKNWKECINKPYNPKKFSSRSDTDRAFAQNIGVRFVSGRSFFLDKPESKWKWSTSLMSIEDRIKHIRKHKDETEPDVLENLEKLPTSEKHLIIIMGPPASGKTMLSKIISAKLKEKNGEEFKVNIVNDQKKNPSKKFTKIITDSLFEQTTIIITKHAGYTQRNSYIKMARKYEMPTLIIYVKTDYNICKILDQTKVQTSRDFSQELHPSQDYNTWKKTFESPGYVEDDVVVLEYPIILKFRQELKFRYSSV